MYVVSQAKAVMTYYDQSLVNEAYVVMAFDLTSHSLACDTKTLKTCLWKEVLIQRIKLVQIVHDNFEPF